MFRAHVLKNVPFRSKHASFLLDDFASWNFLYYGPIAITSNSVFRFDNQSEAGRSMQNCLSGLPLIQTRRWRDPRLILMEVTTLQLKWPWIYVAMACYGHTDVLFKPSKAAEAQFRPTLASDPCSVLSDGRRDDACMMLASP